jgi:Carboxypeptidase regulatory-like domain/TonB-dependent Receptor Plug Domain/TonB dependent receptor
MRPKAIKFMLWVLAIGLSLGISLPVRAQVSGATLSGTITDAQGGTVPDAKVSAKNVGTGISSDTTTNSSGAYSIVNLIPGDYTVSVTAQGFSTTTSKVTLSVGAKQEMSLALTVGQVSQTVEVTGAAPQVELQSSAISDQVTETTVRELPLNGRDWASLATLQPGVIGVRTQRDFTQVGAGGRGLGTQMSIAGGRPTQNSYRLDGAVVNDYSNAGPGSVLGANLGVDAIQEFSVLTSNYSAEYGFTSGGVINAVTRSGTNAFHGSAFDFVRNSVFDARNYFTMVPVLLAKDELKQNQFGASGGWRVLKDKFFLFGAYEGVRRIRGIPNNSTQTISDAVRSGTVVNLSTGAIVPVTIDPVIQKFLALYPHPAAGAGGCVKLAATQFSAPGVLGGCDPNQGFAPYVGKQDATEDFTTERGDYTVSSKDTISGTFVRDNSTVTTPLPFNNELQLLNSYRQVIIAEETHVFSPAWANSLRVAEDRTVNQGGLSPIALNPAAEDPTLGMQAPRFSPNITLTGPGVTAMPGGKNGGASNQQFWGQLFQVYDDAFFNHGAHTFKFGFAFMANQLNIYSPLQPTNGSGTFSSKGIEPAAGGTTQNQTLAEAGCYKGTGSTLAGNGGNYDPSCGGLVNFLTNQPVIAQTVFDSVAIYKHYWRNKIYSGYVQDDWRVRSNLTLNIGLRYEMMTIPKSLDGLPWTLPSITIPIPCGPAVPNFCPQPFNTVSVAGPDPTSVLQPQIYKTNPTTLNFEPRIGFAWDPFHNGKTSVRGGFGMFDVLPLPYIFALLNTQSVPYTSTLAMLGSAVLASPPSIAGCANVVPVGTPPSPCATTTQGEWPYVVPALTSVHNLNPNGRTFMYFDSNIKRNYVYQYNFNIQRQITPSLTLLVGYAGSRAVHNTLEDDTISEVLPSFAANGDAYWPCPMATCAVQSSWIGGLSQFKASSFGPNPTMGSAGSKGVFFEGNSYYNSMQVKVDQRLSHGFQIQGSYTWSKSMDNSSSSASPNSFSLSLSSPPYYNLSWLKGLSEFDIRNNLVINAQWTSPTIKSLGGVGEKVLSGWQFGMIATAANGVPFWLNMGQDFLGENAGTSTNPPFVVAGCSPQGLVTPDYRTNLFYVKASCLSLVPATATNAPYCDSAGRGFSTTLAAASCANIRGDLGRDTIIGPGLLNFDASVFKNNYIRKISETFNIQFRAEFFNILNRTNFAPPPVANLSVFQSNGTQTATMGKITSTQHDNREIQFALKAIW